MFRTVTVDKNHPMQCLLHALSGSKKLPEKYNNHAGQLIIKETMKFSPPTHQLALQLIMVDFVAEFVERKSRNRSQKRTRR